MLCMLIIYVISVSYVLYLLLTKANVITFFDMRHIYLQKKSNKRYYSDFEIVMRPTFDFSSHLLSRGIMLKVIEPQWLADEIYEMHLQAAEMYEER